MNPARYAAALAEVVAGRQPFATATVIRIHGSALGKPGFKILVDAEGKVRAGTLGGVCPEGPIVQLSQEAMMKGQPRIVRVYLEDVQAAVSRTLASRNTDEIHVETNCGGMMEIYIEPSLPPDRLILIGQGGKDDVEDGLVRLAKLLDFEVVVIDHQPVLTEQPDRLIQDLVFDLSTHAFSRSDSVVVLTKGARDVEVLAKLSHVPLRFVGLVASSKRVRQDIDALREGGVAEDFLKSLHSPVGIDIGAVTPMEIALSIMAQVIACKYDKSPPGKEIAYTQPVVSESGRASSRHGLAPAKAHPSST